MIFQLPFIVFFIINVVVNGLSAPLCRRAAATALFPYPQNTVYMFSGKGEQYLKKKNKVLFSDVWKLTPESDKKWTQMQISHDKPSPAARWKSFGDRVVLNNTDYMFIFGGDKINDDTINIEFLNDTWLFNEKEGWKQFHTTNTIAGRRSHCGGVTPSNKVVIFGGKRTPNECINDIHILTFNENHSTGHWKAGTEFPDTCRWGHASAIMVHPETGEEILIVSGGRHSDHYYGEIWLYYINSNEWKRIFDPKKTTLNSYPLPRDHHAIEYIPEEHTLYLFVGRKVHESSSPPLNDCWKFSFIDYTWTQQKSLPTVGRFLPGVSMYYREHNISYPAIALVGGCEITKSQKNIDLNDVWEYDPTKNDWKPLTKAGCHVGDMEIIAEYIISPNVLITLIAIIILGGITLIFFSVYKNP